jgi:hypothetical protein
VPGFDHWIVPVVALVAVGAVLPGLVRRGRRRAQAVR